MSARADKRWLGLGLGRGNIPHPIIVEQISVLQPRLLVVFLCFFAVVWLPTLVSHALMLWPAVPNFASERNAAYVLAFFLVQSLMVCGVIVFLSRRYTAAVWTPQTSWRRGTMVSLLILLPLLLHHFGGSIEGIHGVIVVSRFGDEVGETLASLHHKTWSRLGYGSSLGDVACCSVLSFVAPVLEELVFTGFLFNAIFKRHGLALAALATPACFAFAHAIGFGVGKHLIPLFFAGFTYVMIRIFSGSLLLAVFAHWTINAVIFLPKWAVAWMHFAHA